MKAKTVALVIVSSIVCTIVMNRFRRKGEAPLEPIPVAQPVAAQPSEPEPEKPAAPPAVWIGSCYDHGTKIWYGRATEFSEDVAAPTQKFISKATGKIIQIENPSACVWELE